MILMENELFVQFVLLSGSKIYFFWKKYTSQTKCFFGSLSNWSLWYYWHNKVAAVVRQWCHTADMASSGDTRQLNIKIRKYEKRDHDTVCRIFYNGLMENWVRVKLSAKFRGTQYWRMILGLGTIYNRFFLFRLHSLFLKKLHDIQICFQ